MAALFTFVMILLSLVDGISAAVDQPSRKRQKISKQGTKGPLSVTKRPNKHCSKDSDCVKGKYCHQFHRLCLGAQEQITVAPVRTSAKKCAKDSDCKIGQYCHHMWKICLKSWKVIISPPTKKPSWYCKTSKDCGVDKLCHKKFHACYMRPRVPAVRRSASNSRKCQNQSDCGPTYYCHDHFRLCLKEKIPVVSKITPPKTQDCAFDSECPSGMMCHTLWKFCFKPATSKVVEPSRTGRRGCQIDSDCKKGEFCRIMAGRSTAVTARYLRSIQSVCLPLKYKQRKEPQGVRKCKTNADCGPNKCCLEKLGVCLAYKLPGEMCLMEKTDFVCPCTSGSYCKTRGKSASPKRIINKMKLPQSVANHVMTGGHKKKHKIGRCLPGSLN